MKARFFSIRSHISRATPFGVGVSGLAIAIALAYIGARNKSFAQGVLYTGVWLQSFGLTFVAIGLRDLRKQFQGEALHRRIQKWVQGLWSLIFPGPSQTLQANAADLRGSLRASGTVIATLTSGPTLTEHERIGALERTLAQLQSQVNGSFNALNSTVEEIKAAIATERQERQRLNRTMNETVKQVAMGRFDYELVGLGWLLLALPAASIPDEVAWALTLLF
jgi:hypothetical protein